MKSILIIEDDPILTSYIAQQFKDWEYSLFQICDSVLDAIISINARGPFPDLLIFNIPFPYTRQDQQMLRIFRFLYQIPILFIASVSKQELITALNSFSQAPNIVFKPYTSIQLQKAISKSLKNL